jgi:predicted nucleotide-binding protein
LPPRRTLPQPPQPAHLTPEQMRQGIDRLQKRLAEVSAFDPKSVVEQYNIPHVEALAASVDEALVRTFGAGSLDYNRYSDAAHFDNGPHNYAFEVPIHEVHATLARCKARSLALLKQAIATLEERIADQEALMVTPSTVTRPPTSGKVFVVHGHDGEAREAIARFISERLDLEPVILHERPNKGRTIITKFREESADVGFAVVVMTPDDLGKANDAPNLTPRARQNVVFELGFFIGALGPDRVAAVVKGDLERPSDFDGVVYISFDKEDWRTKLGKELQAAGYAVDWNKVMRQ